MNWEKVRLEDCCVSITDGDHQSIPVTDSGVPFILISNINNNRIDFANSHFVSEDYYEKQDEKRKPRKGDVLYTVIGSFGIPVYVQDDRSFTFQRNIAILKCNHRINSHYLYYVMKNETFYKYADSVATGAAQRVITLTTLRNTVINLPPIEIQNRIASILSAYDALIETNQKQIKLLEEAAQRLYKEWFVDFRFPGYEETRIVDGVPAGWNFLLLSDVFDFVRGKSYTSSELSDSEGVPMVNLKSIRAFGGYNRNNEKRYTGKYKDNQIVKPGDVVMGVTDMTKERRLVGHVALIPNLGQETTFSMDLIKLVPKATSSYYLYSTMFFGGYSKKISPLANGTNVLHLKPEAMMNMKMLVPDNGTLRLYDDRIKPIIQKIELLQDQISRAKEVRDRLLPKLMSGEIEV